MADTGYGAGPPDGRHHVITYGDPFYFRSGLGNLAEGLVADDQMTTSYRRFAIISGFQLYVGPAYPNPGDFYQDVPNPDLRLRHVDDGHGILLARGDRDRFHLPPSGIGDRLPATTQSSIQVERGADQ